MRRLYLCCLLGGRTTFQKFSVDRRDVGRHQASPRLFISLIQRLKRLNLVRFLVCQRFALLKTMGFKVASDLLMF